MSQREGCHPRRKVTRVLGRKHTCTREMDRPTLAVWSPSVVDRRELNLQRLAALRSNQRLHHPWKGARRLKPAPTPYLDLLQVSGASLKPTEHRRSVSTVAPQNRCAEVVNKRGRCLTNCFGGQIPLEGGTKPSAWNHLRREPYLPTLGVLRLA